MLFSNTIYIVYQCVETFPLEKVYTYISFLSYEKAIVMHTLYPNLHEHTRRPSYMVVLVSLCASRPESQLMRRFQNSCTIFLLESSQRDAVLN